MPITTTGRATDFITFSRTSNATVTGADGRIRWAGHNLLTNSESFDASDWTKSSATVTANSETSPNNTTTGDTIAASGANGTALQTWTAEAVPYTFGVWLKRKTGTGTIEIAADSGTYTTVTITSSWALYTVTQTPASGSRNAGIRIVTSGDEVYAWGAHLYRSDLGGMVLNPARGDAYYPTTPRNLLGYTESLTTGWTNTNTTDSIVTETNPNGLASSVEVTATAGNGTLLGSLSLLASPYTFSIWLKRKTGTGTVEITVDGTTYVTAAVTSGWQRFSTTLTPSAGTKTPGIRLVTSGDAVYAWGAQLSDSASLDAYSPVYGAAVTSAAYYAPRLDYDANGSALGLLVEEQRTNLATYSEAFDDAVWAGATAGIASRTANTTVAPTGTSVADTITANNALAAHYIGRSVTWTAAVHTVSVFLKYSTQQFVQLNTWDGTTGRFANFDIQNGVAGTTSNATSTITSFGNGWYRCTMTGSAAQAAASGNWVICFANSNSASATPTYTTAGTEAFFVYGAQLEAGSFATSYIPTGASTATRTADVASVSTQAFPYSASEGTLVASARVYGIDVVRSSGIVSLTNGTSDENIAIFRTGSVNNIAFEIRDNSSTQATYTVAMGAQPIKSAVAYALNNSNAALNGVAQTTDTTCTMPTVTTMQIGAIYTGGDFPTNGWIRQITYLPRRLSNSELAARTV